MFDLKALINYWKGKLYLGCDLGSTCLKVVQIDKSDDGLILVRNGISKIPNYLSSIDRAKKIQTFFREKHFPVNGHIAINVENETLLIRRMDLPKMPERDLKIAIKWNFREFVEGSIEDHIVSYLPIKGVDQSGKMAISASCVSRESVEQSRSLMKDAGLRINAIEPNASALLAVFLNAVTWRPDNYYVLVDLGDQVSNFVVIGNGSLMFSRVLTNLHGRKLVECLQKELGLNAGEAAEQLKSYLTEIEKVDEEYKQKIESAINQFISQMVAELQRSIDAFCIMYKKERVDMMYVCGGGLCLPGIVDSFSKSLGLDVEIFNPFTNILEAETAMKMVSAPLYAVAVGLALPWN